MIELGFAQPVLGTFLTLWGCQMVTVKGRVKVFALGQTPRAWWGWESAHSTATAWLRKDSARF